MEGRNSVTVPNDTVINNNNDNEVMKRNQEALGLDDKIPRKKFKREAVKNANAKKAMAKNVTKKNVPQGAHKNNIHKNKNMRARKDIHKKDLPYDANESLSVSISSSEVTFDGIENKEVFITEDEESESSSKKRKRTSEMEKKEEKQKENKDRRKQYEVALQDYHCNPGMSSQSIMAPFEESICWDWERRFSRKIDSQERFTSVERFAPQASQERFAPKASEERFAPKDELASQESNAIYLRKVS